MRPRSDSVLVWTGASCINGCAACPIDRAGERAGVSQAELLEALLAAGPGDGRLAILTGGEPLIRPDIWHLLAAIRAAGWTAGLITTGRPLVYPQIRARLRRARLGYLRVQLFGTGEAHDRATGMPGGFAQSLAGARAWAEEGGAECDVDVALHVGRARDAAEESPLHPLPAAVEALARELGTAALGILVAIEPALRDAPDQRDLQAALVALAGWNADPQRPLLAWEGLPEFASPAACLAVAPPRHVFAAVRPRATCLGGSESGRQAAELPPRANSFNFVATGRTLPRALTADACTAAAQELHPLRHLWLVRDDRLECYATDTGDFDAAEIGRIKDERSHLFLDRAAPGVLDDFVEGMRRLRPDPICADCQRRARCGRRFEVVEGPPFAREEAWIAAHIAALRGRVLDVGCGEQLYRDTLAPLLRSGAVQYTGLDPDTLSLERIRAALPEGRFHLGGVEDFAGEPGSYDHILCLRSLNHVLDLDEAMARMAALLRPGGSLLLVETTPFAMLRRPEQVAAADRAPRAGHQHFRNVTSEDLLPLARRWGLRVREHSPAALATSNEWILLLERPT